MDVPQRGRHVHERVTIIQFHCGTYPQFANVTVTNKYGLRWDAPHETVYPTTFILDNNGVIGFEKVSSGHGDRLSAQDALDHLGQK